MKNISTIVSSPTDRHCHPVLCAWCLDEGSRTVLGYSTVSHSHGICPRHAAMLHRQTTAAREKIHATAGV